MNRGEGKSFDIATSIVAQVPFFACKNIFLQKKYQEDISKYIYCSDFGISPYPGSYGEQPKKWVSKSFIIKSAIQKRDNQIQRKAMDNAKNENK